MHGLIPHQLHLTRPQITKMMKGQGINIPHSQMGSDKGEVVVLLHPQNARKMLTAYKKGKGMRLIMSPMEMESSMTHGRGIGKAFKKLGRDISRTAKMAGRTIMKDVLEPTGKALASKDAMNVYKEIGRHAIEQGIPIATALGSMALGDPTGMSGAMVGNIAQQYASKSFDKSTGSGLYGGMISPVDARKKYMEMIRSMRGMSAEEREKIKGSGLFKMLSKIGIKKKSVLKGIKKVGKEVVKRGAESIGTAIGAYTGDPMAGAMIGDALGRAGEVGLDSMKPSKHGITFDKGEAVSSLKQDMRELGKAKLHELVAENLPPEYQDVANEVIAGAGVKRGRGRPRKNIMGAGAPQSKAYKQALKANYSGLVMSNVVGDNAPVSKFPVNPRVAPSSEEMTLSPYHSVSSPAMNPFIPTFYTQMGGTQSGYGGKGLF